MRNIGISIKKNVKLSMCFFPKSTHLPKIEHPYIDFPPNKISFKKSLMSKKFSKDANKESPPRAFIFIHSDRKGKHFIMPLLYRFDFHRTVFKMYFY